MLLSAERGENASTNTNTHSLTHTHRAASKTCDREIYRQMFGMRIRRNKLFRLCIYGLLSVSVTTAVVVVVSVVTVVFVIGVLVHLKSACEFRSLQSFYVVEKLLHSHSALSFFVPLPPFVLMLSLLSILPTLSYNMKFNPPFRFVSFYSVLFS